ncbi:MAG: AMIN domain-containing protein [Gemmatimonadetes bacterium]|nr:AMIN domain-containing protein [Gemmatimonadota bacterium]
MTAISVLPSPGSAVVVVDVRGAVNIKDFTLVGPPRLVIDVEGARLKIPGVLYDEMNRGGILGIRYSQFRPDVVRVVLELEYLRDYELEYVDEAIRIAFSTDQFFPAWSSGEPPVMASLVRESPVENVAAPAGSTNLAQVVQQQADRITVTWDSASIADVMAGFAEFSGRSILLGQTDPLFIWAEIKDQPWDVALNEVLNVNGLVAEEDPATGIISIMSMEALAIRDTLEQRQTVIMQINFKRATGMVPVLLATMEQRGGRVIADSLTNQLIITDAISRIDEDTALVRQLDIPTPQVSIQAKLIFVDRTSIEQLGVQYDLGNSKHFFNRLVQRPDPSSFVGIDTDGDGVDDALVAEDTFNPNINVIDLGGNALAAIGNASAILPSPALELIFSTAIGNFNLTAFVSALQEVQLADLQAEPLITTADNTEAQILVGERTPIRVIDAGAQTQTGAGNAGPVATIEFEETGIRLKVTPHVTNTGQVLMRLTAENSSIREAPSDIGFTLQTQLATNEILVNDGETMVIAGLTVTQVTVAKSGIPFLVDLPIVGRLFGFTSRREQRRDLLILVTPTVVYDPRNLGGR